MYSSQKKCPEGNILHSWFSTRHSFSFVKYLWWHVFILNFLITGIWSLILDLNAAHKLKSMCWGLCMCGCLSELPRFTMVKWQARQMILTVSFEWREGRTSDSCGLSRLLIKGVRLSKNGFATGNLKFYRSNFSLLSQMIHCRFCCLSIVSGDFAFCLTMMLSVACQLSHSRPSPYNVFLELFSATFSKINNPAYSTGFLISFLLRSHRSEETMTSKWSCREK